MAISTTADTTNLVQNYADVLRGREKRLVLDITGYTAAVTHLGITNRLEFGACAGIQIQELVTIHQLCRLLTLVLFELQNYNLLSIIDKLPQFSSMYSHFQRPHYDVVPP